MRMTFGNAGYGHGSEEGNATMVQNEYQMFHTAAAAAILYKLILITVNANGTRENNH